LHLRRWLAHGAARGTVHLVHGLGEHIGRYELVARALSAAGWDVAGHDHRGHGRSDGPRGTLGAAPGSDSLLVDLALVFDHHRGSGMQVLLGHSMGGLIAARLVADASATSRATWSRDVDALVLSSPALDAGLSAPQRLLLSALWKLAPELRVGNGLKAEWVSRDPAVVADYRADPLNHDRVTPRLVRFIADAGELVRQRAAAWQVPTLLLWAGADRCVAPAGSRAFAADAPRARVDSHEYAGLYHELFNEPEKAQVIARVITWLNA